MKSIRARKEYCRGFRRGCFRLSCVLVTAISFLLNHAAVRAEFKQVSVRGDNENTGNVINPVNPRPFDLTPNKRVDELIEAAESRRNAGQITRSFQALESALKLAQPIQDKFRLALIYSAISDSYLLLLQLERANHYAEKSLWEANATLNSNLIASSFNQLGHVKLTQRDYPAAMNAYSRGISKTPIDAALKTKLLVNISRTHFQMGNGEEAMKSLYSASKASEEWRKSRDKAYGLIAMAELGQQVHMGGVRVSAILNEALRIADELDDSKARSYIFGQMGALYQSAHRYEQAQRLYHRALFFAVQQSAPELEARWYWRLAQVSKARDANEEAKKYYRKAIQKLRAIQHALVYGLRGQPDFFAESVGSIYREYAELLLDETNGIEQPDLKISLLKEVRTVMEGLKVVQLKNYFLDECVTAQIESNVSLDIDDLITSGTATIYPIAFSGRLIILMSLANGQLKQFTVPLKMTELRTTVSTYLRDLGLAGNPWRLRRNAETLYGWLIKPLLKDLRDHTVHTLVVVPDGILRTIPFAALYDGKKFLIDEFAISISPGLTLTDPDLHPRSYDRILLNGLSDRVQGFSPLPHVTREIDLIASLYNSTRLVNKDFRSEEVETQLRKNPFPVISFSTHSSFLSDPKRSFLLTYNGKITLDELEELVSLGRTYQQPVDLLVLSACETARGDERAALGFAGIAVKAGARSVLGSLWLVSDVSTGILIPSFFEFLKDPELSKAQALQKAQIRLINDSQYSHPYYWAAFVLIGNWL